MENKYEGNGILYDLSILAELDDPGYVLEMISLFLSNYPIDLAALTKAVEAEEWPEVERRAHKIKGATGILQATSISTLLATMEMNARDKKELARVPEQLTALQELLSVLHEQLLWEQEQIQKGMV